MSVRFGSGLGVFCDFFFSWFFNKNDKTQNILHVNFGGRLCFAPGIPLSFIDYLANVLQGLFYGVKFLWRSQRDFFCVRKI